MADLGRQVLETVRSGGHRARPIPPPRRTDPGPDESPEDYHRRRAAAETQDRRDADRAVVLNVATLGTLLRGMWWLYEAGDTEGGDELSAHVSAQGWPEVTDLPPPPRAMFAAAAMIGAGR